MCSVGQIARIYKLANLLYTRCLEAGNGDGLTVRYLQEEVNRNGDGLTVR